MSPWLTLVRIQVSLVYVIKIMRPKYDLKVNMLDGDSRSGTMLTNRDQLLVTKVIGMKSSTEDDRTLQFFEDNRSTTTTSNG